MTRRRSESEERPSKKQKTSSGSVLSDETALFESASSISEAFNSAKSLDTAVTTVSSTPFPSIVFDNLFSSDVLHEVKQELLSQAYYPRKSDLFSYYGTNDLSTSTDSPVARLRSKLYSEEFTTFLQDATGVVLIPGKVDMSSHIYKRGDWLGCHDDDIASTETGRRIAFIIYLVDEDWSEQDGGELALFDLDSGGNPGKIKHSISPKWNRMALFEVTPSSFHEVREVTTSTDNRFRLSISGWFHGSLSSRLALRNFLPLQSSAQPTEKLINPLYLDAAKQAELKETFVESSVLTLPDFLHSDFVIDQRLMDEIAWRDDIGPASVRRFGQLYAPASVGTLALESIKQWFASEKGWDFLMAITGLEGRPRCRSMVRKFGQGCYTMVHDHALDPLGLDAVLCLGPEKWEKEWGGAVVYTSAADDSPSSQSQPEENGKSNGANGQENEEESEAEDGELMRAEVSRNTLTLVLRDKGTLRYVDRVNCRAEGARVDIEALYRVEM